MVVTNEYTASSSGASGPGEACGEDSPRCTDSHAAQSCRLVMSQNSTAYPGSKSGWATASGANAQVHSIRVRSAATGISRCVIT